MAKGNPQKEKQLRDRYVAAQKKFGKGSPEALAARGGLNDYLESIGRPTNRRPGEGKGANNLTTAAGVIDEQEDQAFGNTYTPTGAQTYTKNPDGTTTMTVGLSDAEQAKLGGEQRRDTEINTQIANALSQTRDATGRPIDTSGMVQADFNKIDPTKLNYDDVVRALAGSKGEALQRKHDNELRNLQSKLASEGVSMNSPKALARMAALTDQHRLDNTELQSLISTEAKNVLGANSAAASSWYSGQEGVLNQRDQQYQEAMTARNMPYADMANLSGLYGQSSVNWPNVPDRQYVDAQGTAMGFAGMANDKDIANIGAKAGVNIANINRSTALETARIGAASRGGAGEVDDTADIESGVDTMPGSGAGGPPPGNTSIGKTLTDPNAYTRNRSRSQLFGKAKSFQGGFF